MTDTSHPPTDDISPGRYMRLRREAARLTVDQVAAFVGGTPSDARDLAELLHRLERNEPMAGAELELVDRLAGARVFRFDLGIYMMLVGRRADPHGDLPLPGICRTCGCSWNDPCSDGMGEGCGWANSDATLCTMCIGRAPANDVGEAGHAA
jgi:hypothetical protein